MGKGDEFKEYKKSKLTSGDIGIRIIGTTENLEFIRNLFGENFRLPLSSQINKLKRGTANISEILYAKLYFHLKKPKTCTLRIWLLKFNLYKVLKTNVLGIIFTCLKSIYFLTFLSAKTHYQKQSNIFIPNKRLWCYY